MSKHIAIDFGTSNTLIYSKEKGIIFNQPSVVAIDNNINKVLTVGNEAQQMIGKTPTNISVIKPFRYGSIDKFNIAIRMLKMMIDHTKEGNRFSKAFAKAHVLVGVPSMITQVESKGIEEVIRESGAKKVILIKDVIADAVSLGEDIFKPIISFIVDIGGGTTDIAAISLGGILAEESIKIGSNDIDVAIMHYIKTAYNVEIGELTAENVKIQLADAMIEKEKSAEVIGQDLASGLPITLELNNYEIYEAIKTPIETICYSVKTVLENCPPESVADILSRGIILTGGGSKLRNLDKLLKRELGITAVLIDTPEFSTINGLGALLNNMNTIHNMIIEYKPYITRSSLQNEEQE